MLKFGVGDDLGFRELLIALERGLRIGEQGLRPLELGASFARIQFGEELSFLNPVSLLDAHSEDRSSKQRIDPDGANRLDRPSDHDRTGEVSGGDLRDGHRDGTDGASTLGTTRLPTSPAGRERGR